MFNFIKDKLKKIYSSVTNKLQGLFAQKTIDQKTLDTLKELLITADTGVATTNKIIDSLHVQYKTGSLADGEALQKALERELIQMLNVQKPHSQNRVFLLVGINGSGKTTFAGKFAHYFTERGKRCLLAAADTFRAAAPEQLTEWSKKSNASLFSGKQDQDPAAVVFGACNLFKQENFDVLIIDTAGRLQTKDNLMKELEKIKRIVAKQLPEYSITTLLTIDAMLGQNSFSQAKIFNEATTVDGVILTKMDGTGKGGIIFSITEELKIPVCYISYGESISDIKAFDAEDYVTNLLHDSHFSGE